MKKCFNVPLGLTFWHWKSLSIHFHHQLWVLLRQLLSSLPLNQSCFGPIRTCTRLSSYIFTSAMMHSFLVLNLQAKPGKGYTFKYSSVIDLKGSHMTKSYHLIQSDLQISVKYLITVNASTWITCTQRIKAKKGKKLSKLGWRLDFSFSSAMFYCFRCGGCLTVWPYLP